MATNVPPVLPPDFPYPVAGVLEKIRHVSESLHDKIVRIINETWGDVGKLKHIRDNVWAKAISVAEGSMSDLQTDLDRLNGVKEANLWRGEARNEYIAWRNNLNAHNVIPTYNNLVEIKNRLDEAIHKVEGARIRIVAMVVEVAVTVGGMATAENPVSAAAAIIAGLSLVGTFLEFQLNLRNEFDALGNNLETLRDAHKIGYDDGLSYGVPPKFSADVISNWKDWEWTQRPPTLGN